MVHLIAGPTGLKPRLTNSGLPGMSGLHSGDFSNPRQSVLVIHPGMSPGLSQLETDSQDILLSLVSLKVKISVGFQMWLWLQWL